MLSKSDETTARRSILLGTIPPDIADQLMGRAHVREFARGETIFVQEEHAHSVFVVLEGWIKLYRIAQNGSEAVVGVFKSGDSFGEAVAFRNDAYPVTAEAVSDCRLLQIRADIVLEMMRSRPEICTAMLAATFRHLQELVRQIEQLKARSGAQRVAEFMLELCPVETGACTVTLPFDKVLLAGRLGMKPESLSRAFGRLKGAGVQISRERAAIADVERLRDYAEQDRAEAWSRAR
ncbi:cyclic nucleotide-binding protein [Maritimibacter sp. 55A14]|uniref:Crp/Fnr family transcriptional regulator n=1 Tax=Maritimibacter sp. 55A14 TaxID=2174844 RepID=UPI000D603956|nr:Crp/Fnr family transcriptional regulator [Maritimibacter sp. 55A14]PWE34333.1 cyclic nucleotide-binding protein [Maritimibacter sp. 55A14]